MTKSLKQYRLEKGLTKRHQLSPKEIGEVTTLRSQGVSYSKIARIYDRNQSTIIKVVKRYYTSKQYST